MDKDELFQKWQYIVYAMEHHHNTDTATKDDLKILGISHNLTFFVIKEGLEYLPFDSIGRPATIAAMEVWIHDHGDEQLSTFLKTYVDAVLKRGPDIPDKVKHYLIYVVSEVREEALNIIRFHSTFTI